jgi:hypothetical protein
MATAILLIVLSCTTALFAQTTSPNPARELVATYCITCHNDRLKTGSLTLEHVDTQQVSKGAETWGKRRPQAAEPLDASRRQPKTGQRDV